MAQYRATIRGQRGEASRLGFKTSGLYVTANGWNGGVSVTVHHKDGKDHFKVVRTGGSNQSEPYRVLAEFEAEG